MKLRVVMKTAMYVLCFTLGLHVQTGVAAEARVARQAAADGIIVKYRSEQIGANLSERVRIAGLAARQRGITLTYERAGALGTHVLKLDREVSLVEAQEIARLIQSGDANVEYAEPDLILNPTFSPNDPDYPFQWHYYESTGGLNLPSAWDLSTGVGVVVAVLDSGYRPHADLSANIVGGYDFISNTTMAGDGNGRDSSALDPGNYCTSTGSNSNWHGTHVAGTIAAVTNNSTGVAGVAFGAKILPVRVLGRCGGNASDIADAIVWASGGSVSGVPANPHPARVLNLSLGGTSSCLTSFQNAINSARSRSSVVVVSAGNDDQDAANASPANCNGVITVAATNRSGGRAFFYPPQASNYGATVEIAAPGGEVVSVASNGVLSTLNTGTTGPGSDNYAYYQGTSMAAPHVAGTAALMLSVNPGLSPDDVLSILQSTARTFPGTCNQCGSGIVDASAAVNAVPAPVGYVDNLTISIYSAGAAWGYIQGGSFGTLTPNTTTTGKTYHSIYGWSNWVTATSGMKFIVCGFTSNPGSTWLTSISSNGSTIYGSAATFSYGTSGTWAGCGTWDWVGYITFWPQLSVTHQ